MTVNNWKVWPHLTIIAIVCAIAAGVGVGWWVKHEQTASAEALPNAARIQRIDGDVALNNANSADDASADQWVNATTNQPFSVGDRIYTRENSHASLAFTGRNFARLNPNSSLDVLSLADRRTQLALRDGSAMFDVGYLAPDELFEVATPYGAVDLQRPGLYDVGIDNGNVIVSVLSGLAQVAGLGGTGQINKGEVLRLLGQTAADAVLSRIDGRDAGYLVDDYYGYQYPQYYDGRYRDYNTYLNDPYYFDPYRRTSSYQYVNSYIPGISDLDYYGNWQNLNGYGYAWSPRVDNSWSPYEDGYWMNDYPYGPTWVSSEPWGYAPYHYGRWTNVGNQWYWIPDRANTTPTYSPAMVAFVPVDQNDIGWVPLGPNDPYAPRYYNRDWSPSYLSRTQIIQSRLANLYVPNAVSVVPIDDFVRGVDSRRARKADREMLSRVNPVLDPLTLTPLRNAAVHSAWGRGKKDLPPGIAKKLFDTTVVTSSDPIVPRYRQDLKRTMRVESVDERSSRKFNVRDERGGRGGPDAAQAPDQTRASDRERNPGQARQEEKRAAEVQQQQQRVENSVREAQSGRGNRGNRVFVPQQQQPQGEKVGHKMKEQPQAAPTRGQARQEQVPQAERHQQQQPSFARPREQRAETKPGRGNQRSQQPAPVQQQQPQANPAQQRVQNPGRGRSEMKKQERQGTPNPQAQSAPGNSAGNGKGGGKGHKKP